MKTARALLALALCAAAAAGCGSMAARYAREARSSYISARAVMAGLQEFPSRMEQLLRKGDWEKLGEQGEDLIEDARGLVTASSAAFRTVAEKCDALEAENSRRHLSYAEKLRELVRRNEEIIGGYAEFIGLSASALEGIPYEDDPRALMYVLEAMDAAAARIRERFAELELQEEEAEAVYREIAG